MKAQLIEITEVLAGNKEFADVLMKNLNAINDMQEEREKATASRLSDISAKIDKWGKALNSNIAVNNLAINERIDSVDTRINNVNKKLNTILKLLNIDPTNDLLIE